MDPDPARLRLEAAGLSADWGEGPRLRPEGLAALLGYVWPDMTGRCRMSESTSWGSRTSRQCQVAGRALWSVERLGLPGGRRTGSTAGTARLRLHHPVHQRPRVSAGFHGASREPLPGGRVPHTRPSSALKSFGGNPVRVRIPPGHSFMSCHGSATVPERFSGFGALPPSRVSRYRTPVMLAQPRALPGRARRPRLKVGPDRRMGGRFLLSRSPKVAMAPARG
jgi:hypothetical protein